jgi:hypothetical protein
MTTHRAMVRRSVAIPGELVEEAMAVAEPELRDNFNRLAIVAVEEFTASRKATLFEHAMAAMAADPAVKRVSASIERSFRAAERDGLPEE